MNNVSFVIPAYNNWKLTKQILKDIHKNCSSTFEVIVVNNGSMDETGQGLEDWFSWRQLTEIRLNENVGFLKATNIGLREATGEVVITVSNDVRINADISNSISSILSSNPRSFVGGKLWHTDTGWNTFDGRIFPYIEGWLMATTREGWKELDYLDERYAPSDFEDIDVSTKALFFGYKLVPLNNPSIVHLGAQTLGYNPEREAITRRNREYFREKWLV